MSLVEREYGRTNEGGVCTALIEYDDVTLQLMALIMRGNINERSLIGIGGSGESRTDGMRDVPEIRMDLTAESITLVTDSDGGVSLPSGLTIALEALDDKPAKVNNRRERLKPREPIRRR